MRLERLIGHGFRNLQPFDLRFDSPFTVFYGENAQGKTNALEAIWYFCALKPLRTHRAKEVIQWGEETCTLSGTSTAAQIKTQRRVSLSSSKRVIVVNGKKCASIQEYFTDLRAIAFTPADGEIISGGPDVRRRWVDRATFTARPAHLSLVRNYSRALRNKGASLRSPQVDHDLLDALDTQLAQLGAQLSQQRACLLDELRCHVSETVQFLSGHPVEISLRLQTVAKGRTLRDRSVSLSQALHRARDGEVRRRRTLTGSQLDEVVIELDGRPARNFASRGQIRTLVLGLKLAELLAARERGSVPLFLVDDLSSELDKGRTIRLVERLTDLGAQIIVTTTDLAHVSGSAQISNQVIRVEAGDLSVPVAARSEEKKD